MTKHKHLTPDSVETFVLTAQNARVGTRVGVLMPNDPRGFNLARVREVLAREPELRAGLQVAIDRVKPSTGGSLPPALAELRARVLSAAELDRARSETPREVSAFADELARYLVAIEGFSPGATP
jgi:hypothetical protein